MIFISIYNDNRLDKNNLIKIDIKLYFKLSIQLNNSY